MTSRPRIDRERNLPTVSVVNSYEAVSDAVFVILFNSVDWMTVSNQVRVNHQNHTFPTDGKPIRATLASPDF
jgi:hypothetical protein